MRQRPSFKRIVVESASGDVIGKPASALVTRLPSSDHEVVTTGVVVVTGVVTGADGELPPPHATVDTHK